MTPARRGVFQLAQNLGMTVQQLETNMTVGEFVEWLDFYKQQKQDEGIDLANASQQQLGALFNG